MSRINLSYNIEETINEMVEYGLLKFNTIKFQQNLKNKNVNENIFSFSLGRHEGHSTFIKNYLNNNRNSICFVKDMQYIDHMTRFNGFENIRNQLYSIKLSLHKIFIGVKPFKYDVIFVDNYTNSDLTKEDIYKLSQYTKVLFLIQ